MKRYTKTQKMIILNELDTVSSNAAVLRLLATHNLTTEEIESWRIRKSKYGINGLQATKINHMFHQ